MFFPAVQPRRQLVLQLQQFEVRLWVLVTEQEDDLQPLQQLLQILLCTSLSGLGQVLFRPTGKGSKRHNLVDIKRGLLGCTAMVCKEKHLAV